MMNTAWHVGSLSVETPPQRPVLTMEAVRHHLHIDSSEDDPVLERMLAAAVSKVDGPHGIGWALLPQTWRWTLTGWLMGDEMPLPGHPVTGLTRVERMLDDGSWVAVSGVSLIESDAPEHASLIVPPSSGWPEVSTDRPWGIRIIYELGSESVPEELLIAILMIVGQWYEAREGMAMGMMEIPHGATQILRRYQNMVGMFG